MKIIHGYPPNFAQIAAAFPSAKAPGVIFTYGDTIYNTGPLELTEALKAHEAVHSRQQGASPDAWWQTYILSPEWRFKQELEAHRAELLVLFEGSNRHVRRSSLKQVAARLAGPLYGNCISLATAKRLLAV